MHAALLALILGAVGPPSRPEGEGHELGKMVASLLRATETAAFSCTVVRTQTMHLPDPVGAAGLLAAETRDGRLVLATDGGRLSRMRRQDAFLFKSLEFGDRVKLRGRAVRLERWKSPILKHLKGRGVVALLVESVESVILRPGHSLPKTGARRPGGLVWGGSPGSGPARQGLEDVLRGPFPFAATVDLGPGGEMEARVLGFDFEEMNVRLRASLTEIALPLSKIRGAVRKGGGVSFRFRDGRLDFFESMEPGSAAEHAFRPVAGLVSRSWEKGSGSVRGEILAGLRLGREFGLLLRSGDLGEYLVLLASGGHRPVDPGICSLVKGLRRGNRVSISVTMSDSGHLRTSRPSRDRGPPIQLEGAHRIVPPPDPDRACLPSSVRRGLQEAASRAEDEALELGAQLDKGLKAAILGLEGRALRSGLRLVSDLLDRTGSPAAAALLRDASARAGPYECPPEVAGAALRGLFGRDRSVRLSCAEALGLIGCREAIPALEQAPDSRGPGWGRDAALAQAARRAIERIRAVSPRQTGPAR